MANSSQHVVETSVPPNKRQARKLPTKRGAKEASGSDGTRVPWLGCAIVEGETKEVYVHSGSTWECLEKWQCSMQKPTL